MTLCEIVTKKIADRSLIGEKLPLCGVIGYRPCTDASFYLVLTSFACGILDMPRFSRKLLLVLQTPVVLVWGLLTLTFSTDIFNSWTCAFGLSMITSESFHEVGVMGFLF